MPDTRRTALGDSSTEKSGDAQPIAPIKTRHQPYQALLSSIDNQTSILTPNRRLSATLHKRCQTTKAANGETCWETPDILPAINWINRLWQSCISQSFDAFPHLLNASQKQILWESILRKSKENPLLLQITETASTIHSAWSLLKQWQISLDHPALTSSEDYASMKKWGDTFQAICQQRHWIDDASIIDILIICIEQKNIVLPKRLILTGFTDYSPQMTALLEACQKQGTQVIYYEPQACEYHQISRCQLDNIEAELITIARWAKAILDQHPDVTIGCVVPTLDEVRDKAEQIFSQIFMPPGTTTQYEHTPFNISAGKPIAHYPVIQAALNLLTLVKPAIPINTFNQILTTPFIGEAEQERVKRAKVDTLLRKANVMTVELNQFAFHQHCPQLAKRLTQFLTLLNECKPYQTHHEWVLFISHALETLGWPGERSINSEEYQAIQRWLALLVEFRQLDQVSTPISISEAIDRLNQLASKSFYQPQTPDAPIQILGLLEAAALPFDYLWVSGMDDISWPPAPKPNPFIPKQLQREQQMPHATAERELTFCTRIMSQFSRTSGTLIYSHAARNEKVELQASPLIQTIPLINASMLPLSPHESLWEKLYHQKDNEIVIDIQGPAVTSNKSIGGTRLIQSQAICPFKAFAEHRLHARDIETPLTGLRPKDRGNIIHQIMESIWLHLQDQASLLVLTDEELASLIHDTITQALQSELNSRSAYHHYTQLEHQRLHKLIWQWMQLEKARNNFKVTAHEKQTEIHLDQLTFTCKVDRIDQLDDQRCMIIDYKTGKNNHYKFWFGDRPEEPQLPIYTLGNPDIAAVAYAQINTSDLAFIGIGDEVDIDGISPLNKIKLADKKSWAEQLDAWNTILTQLANDFAAGKAMVDPKDAVKSCEYCSLKPLCRIHEENPSYAA